MHLISPLPSTPLGVSTARRLVADALEGSPHEPLLDVVLLLVSELVTNAVLHAGTAVCLEVTAEEGEIRVEVADGSPVLPTQRRYDADASTGRGLGLVALLSSEFGADRRDGGKVVWSVLRPDDVDEGPPDPEAVLDRWNLDELEPTEPGGRPVRLEGVPVRLFRAMQQHNDALLREHALMGDHVGPPPHLDVDLRPVDEVLRRSAVHGVPAVDLELRAGPAAADTARALLDVLAAADEQAFAGNMLTPPALPEVRWCRVWHLEEIARQVTGAPPRPWAPLDVQHRELEGIGEIDTSTVLDALSGAVVVGDDQNRITYANRAACRLLGWRLEELAGKRLTALIPERLREAHLAGYTRYLVTGERRLIGRPVRVPARRRDGSEVEVEMELSALHTADQRPLLVASLRPVDGTGPARADARVQAALAAGTAVVSLLAGRTERVALMDVAEEVLALLGQTLGSAVVALWRLDGAALRCAASWSRHAGADRAFLEASDALRLPSGAGLPGRVWAGGQPVVIPDLVADPGFARGEEATRAGLRSALAFPVGSGPGRAAVIELFDAEPRDADPNVLDQVAAVGANLAALTRAAG